MAKSCEKDNNSELLEKFPGEKKVLLSTDSMEFDDPAMNAHQPCSVKFLNSLVSSSLPLAHLALKVGCPIMLLQNLDPSRAFAMEQD